MTASGSMAVYDVTSCAAGVGTAAVRQQWPTLLEKPAKGWNFSSDTPEHWVDLTDIGNRDQSEPRIPSPCKAGRGSGIASMPKFPGSLCRVNLDLWSSDDTDALIEISWFDAEGKVVGRTGSGGHGKSDYGAWLLCDLSRPKQKAAGSILREWKQKPLRLKRAAATFWKPEAMPSRGAARRAVVTRTGGAR